MFLTPTTYQRISETVKHSSSIRTSNNKLDKTIKVKYGVFKVAIVLLQHIV